MTPPNAVVIPFSVPEGQVGLGLGLAALVHTFTRIGGQSVGLAQLYQSSPEEPEPRPVEAFVPPGAWKELEARSEGRAGESPRLVLTGNFEPPSDGPGIFQLVAFEPKSGETRASGEALLDADNTGALVLSVIEHLFEHVEGSLGSMKDIRGLSWEVLESVLHAERCVVHDPARGAPRDALAALMHLGRAVADAPMASFPAGRLADLALDAVSSRPSDDKFAAAALRTLSRATSDAASQVSLLEATAALELRMGLLDSAESRIREGLLVSNERSKLVALSATAHRLRGNFAESRNVLDEAAPRFPNDPLLATERGVLLLAEGKGAEAAQVWLTLLRTHGLMLSTFVHATEWALRESDAGVASNLVDCVLEIPNAPVAFLRMALKLAESLEPKGLPRAARLADLCIRLLAQTPGDSIARLVLARAYGEQGENAKGLAELALVRESMKDTPMSAEADRLTFSLREPEVAATLDAILRAAEEADVGDLDLVAARAHKIAFEYEIWTAHYALGIAEKRKGRYATARRSFEAAIALSKGAVPAYVEAASVTLSLGEARAALPLAERATVLDPEHALAWAYLARARLALGERVLAREAIARATALAPGNETLSALESRVLRANESTFFSKVRALFQRG